MIGVRQGRTSNRAVPWLLLSLSTWACRASSRSAVPLPTSSRATSSPSSDADQKNESPSRVDAVVGQIVGRLNEADGAGLFAMCDAAMEQDLPLDQVESFVKDAATTHGDIRSWVRLDGEQSPDGTQYRLTGARCDVLMTLSLDLDGLIRRLTIHADRRL
jgi:hypothetical protein